MRFGCVALVGGLVGVLSAVAGGQIVVGVNNSAFPIAVYDVSTGLYTADLLAAPTGMRVHGLTADDRRRVFYAVGLPPAPTLPPFSTSVSALYTIPYDNPAAYTAIPLIGPETTNVEGLAWHEPTQSLYAIGGSSSASRVMRINRVTGARELVWFVGVGNFIGGFDYCEATDKFYVTNNTTASTALFPFSYTIYDLDIFNQTATPVTVYPIKGMSGETDLDGIACGGGYLWLSADESNWLYRYNLATDVFDAPIEQTWITSAQSFSGAAWAPSLLPADGDLQIIVNDSPDPLVLPVNTEITYTVTLRNNGSTTLNNIVINGTVPSGLSFVSSTAGGFTAPDQFDHVVASLAASSTVTFQVVLSTTTPATYSFTLSATADEADPRPFNNSMTAVTLARLQQVDLLAALATPACPVAPGSPQTHSFTISSKAISEKTATGVVFTIDLDPSYSMVSSVPAGTLTGSQLVIPLSDIAVSGSVPVTVSFQTALAPGGVAQTTVSSYSVVSTEADFTPADNAGTATFRIRPSATSIETVWTTQSGAGLPNQAPGLPAGNLFSTVALLRPPVVSPNGQYWLQWVDTTFTTTSQDVILIRGSGLMVQQVAREGITANIPGSANTSAIAAFDVRSGIGNFGEFAIGVDLSGSTSNDELIVFGTSAFPPVLSTVAAEASPVPVYSPSSINYGSTSDSASVQVNGTVSFYSNLSGSTSGDFAVFGQNGTVELVRRGLTEPDGQFDDIVYPLATIATGSFYRDCFGDNMLYSGTVNDSGFNDAFDQVTVYNNQVVIQESVTHPSLGSPFGSAGAAQVYQSGTGIWMARGAMQNNDDYVLRMGEVVAQTDTPIFIGSTELWDDNTGGATATFSHIMANEVGDYVIGGWTNSPNLLANQVLVLNGTTVLARENDPVDLNNNGVFDDDRYIRTFVDDAGFITNDGWVYVMVRLRSGSSAFCGTTDTDQSQALIRIPFTPTPPLSRDVAVNMQIDSADLATVLSGLGQPSSTLDFNRSGQVTITDARLLLEVFGTMLP
mgnify:CR=1 FL=1